MNLIGITGYAGSGKSTLAELICNSDPSWKRIRFAGPIKSVMIELGLTTEQVDGEEKEVPCSLLCGKTPRYAMQTFGTEWGRRLIGESIWLNVFKRRAECLLADGFNVVVDDVRFPNEAEFIRSLGGKIVKVMRGMDRPRMQHESESYIDRINEDHTIYNDLDTTHLGCCIVEFLEMEGAR